MISTTIHEQSLCLPRFGAAQAESCRQNFPALQSPTLDGHPIAFLDGSAGTQTPRSVIEAMAEYQRKHNANTGGAFSTSVISDQLLERSRHLATIFAGANRGQEITFGQNMTTLTLLASEALARHLEPGDEVIITQLDHEANRSAWLGLRHRGLTILEARLCSPGIVDLDHLESLLSSRTRLIAIGLASNLLGTVLDLEPIRQLVSRAGSSFVTERVESPAGQGAATQQYWEYCEEPQRGTGG